MGLSSKSGFACTDLDNPVAFKVCDRCGRWRNGNDLVWQYQFAGNDLLNLRLLVCFDRCNDVPQQQLRSIVLPPDPIPKKIRDLSHSHRTPMAVTWQAQIRLFTMEPREQILLRTGTSPVKIGTRPEANGI